MRNLLALSVLAASMSLGACKPLGTEETNDEPVTTGEALQAIEESALSSQAINLTATSIELTTDFTIGGAAAAAAAEIGEFIASQLPCAEITLADAELTVVYGALEGSCVYRGKEFDGIHRIEVVSVEEGNLEIAHTWEGFTNGVVSVSGTADVTWGFDGALSRQVEHDLTWTRVADGRSGHDTGSRLQQPHDEGLEIGLRADGERSWDGERGTFVLVEDDVQARWVDPVPEQGSYTLTLPNDKTVSLSFARADEDTITVTLESGGKSFSFDVTKSGAIKQGADDQS